MFLRDVVNTSTATPGRPSGVCSSAASSFVPASQPQPMIDVAKPVAASAAVRAQLHVVPGHDQPRTPHAKGLGERVLDLHSVDVHEGLAPFPEGDGQTP